MQYGLGEHIIKQINAVFVQFPQIERAVIYGSRAKGNYKIGSDIDICLIGEGLEQKQYTRISQLLDDLPIPYMVDLSIYHHVENPQFLNHINRIGQNFYVARI